MIDGLARGLTALGHEVRLFTIGSSTCPVDRGWFHRAAPERIGSDLAGLSHALACEYLDAVGCDVIHDHTLAGLALAAAGWTTTPVVTTNHGPFAPDLVDLYCRVAQRVPIVAISADQAARAPAGVPITAVIHHDVDLSRYLPRTTRKRSGGYPLCLGRMSPDKGIDAAITAARAPGRRLLIAAKMREPDEHAYYRDRIELLLNDQIRYVGEVGHDAKIDLLRRADALVNPIRWPEPFGLVMIEALACGTPVIATPNGAAPEIVTPGVNGYLATPDHLTDAIGHLDQIDRRRAGRPDLVPAHLRNRRRRRGSRQ
jgi:glycosyltransferase involved in cell wall biosynthesis